MLQIPANCYTQFGWFSSSELLNLRQGSELKFILQVTSDRTIGKSGRIYFRSCVPWGAV